MPRLSRRRAIFLGWTVVLAAGFSEFAAVSFFNPVLGVFMPALTSEFGWGRTEISLGMSIGTLLGAFVSPFAGTLVDRYGGRALIVGASAVMVVALVLLALIQSIWQFYVLFALGRATVSAVLMLAATVTVSKWFVRQRGLAVGAATIGSRVGFALLPIGIQLIIGGWGWREAWLVLAVLVFVCVLPPLRFLHARPEDFGLRPDGDAAPSPATEPQLRVADAAYWTREAALRTPTFWLVTAAAGLQVWAGGAINLHQIPHLVDRGLSPEAAALTISLFATVGAVSTILQGFLDQRLGSRWTYIIGLLASAGGVVILINVHSTAMALLYAVGYGISFGIMVTSNQVVFAYYFGREALGAIRGSATMFQLTLNAIGPLVAGAAYDLTGSYLAAFIPFTVAYVLAAAALLVARRPTPPAAPS